jgi:D-aminopeptidase
MAHHGSGDLMLAFSTANGIQRGQEETTQSLTQLADQRLDPLYQATVEASEESIYNALLGATTTVGRDGARAEAIDPVRLQELLRSHGRL